MQAETGIEEGRGIPVGNGQRNKSGQLPVTLQHRICSMRLKLLAATRAVASISSVALQGL